MLDFDHVGDGDRRPFRMNEEFTALEGKPPRGVQLLLRRHHT
jgi:hypothetical protein